MLSSLLAAALAADADLASLDRALDRAEAAGVVHGEVMVVDGEQEVYRRLLGDAPRGGRYRIGSISKSFTAALVLQLVDEGVLTLDTPAAELLPDVPELGGDEPILIRHLLHHTSGLGPIQVGPFAVEPTFDQWLVGARSTEQLGRRSKPGERYAYSNGGYLLLSEIVRRKRSTSFEEALRSQILEPLSLRDTAITRAEREVDGHLWTDIGLVRARQALPRWVGHDFRWDLGGAGAITSTPSDLLRWARAMRDGALLSDASRTAAITPALEDYGMGWGRKADHVWHNGALSPIGTYAYLRWSVADERVVVVVNAVDISATSQELGPFVEAALRGESPEIRGARSVPGVIAMASTVYAPWFLGLGAVAGFAWWAGRPSRSHVAVVFGGCVALGFSVAVFATSGPMAIALAATGTALASARAWPRAQRSRPPLWPLGALVAATTLSGGLVWAALMLFVMQLIADPWAFFAAVAP